MRNSDPITTGQVIGLILALYVLIGSSLGLAAWLGVGVNSFIEPTPTPTATPQTLKVTESAKIEYYRAVFDLCTYYGRKSQISSAKMKSTCFELVKQAEARNWFEMGSPGWEWPIPGQEEDGTNEN